MPAAAAAQLVADLGLGVGVVHLLGGEPAAGAGQYESGGVDGVELGVEALLVRLVDSEGVAQREAGGKRVEQFVAAGVLPRAVHIVGVAVECVGGHLDDAVACGDESAVIHAPVFEILKFEIEPGARSEDHAHRRGEEEPMDEAMIAETARVLPGDIHAVEQLVARERTGHVEGAAIVVVAA